MSNSNRNRTLMTENWPGRTAKNRRRSKTTMWFLTILILTAFGGVSFLATQPVAAASYNVTSSNDNGLGNITGTLSKAIKDANTAAGADTITLGTNVTLTGVPKVMIESDITFVGNSNTIMVVLQLQVFIAPSS